MPDQRCSNQNVTERSRHEPDDGNRLEFPELAEVADDRNADAGAYPAHCEVNIRSAISDYQRQKVDIHNCAMAQIAMAETIQWFDVRTFTRHAKNSCTRRAITVYGKGEQARRCIVTKYLTVNTGSTGPQSIQWMEQTSVTT